MKRTLLLSMLAAVIASGCSTNGPSREPTYEQAAQDRLLESSRNAADQLIDGISRDAYGNAPLLVATLVSVDDLRRSSTLGRSLSEQYASRFVARGFNVKELKLRGDVFVQEGTGELMLSREIKDIAKAHSATLVLVGTYSVASNLSYISLKLVRTEDGRIMQAYDYALPNDKNVMRMLQTAR